MVNGFNRLRHNPVIRCYDQDGNIGNRCTTCPHRGEGRVSRCIQEGNLLAIFNDLVGTDMLSDTTCFTCRNTRVTKGIQEGCFTMVNVSHDGYNWWTLNQFIFVKITIFDKETFDVGIIHFNLLFGFDTVIHHEEFDGFSIQRLVLCGHNSHHEKLLNDFCWFTFDTFCDFRNSHTICILKFCWQFMELALCNRFWSLVTVILLVAFFILFVVIPVTISLISHLVLTTSILLLFSWTIFFTIKIFTFFVWSSLLFPTCINCCRTWTRYWSCFHWLRLWL